MNYKSHTQKEIADAHRNGTPIWELDTENDGLDDVLFGKYEDVLGDVLNHHDLGSMPNNWTLERITPRTTEVTERQELKMKIEKKVAKQRAPQVTVVLTTAQKSWIKTQAQKNSVGTSHVIRACVDQARSIDAEKSSHSV